MRSLLLLLTLAAGYALLRGWPSDWHPVVRITLAGTALIATLWFWGKTNKSSTPDALPAKRPGLIDFAGIAIVLLLIECLILAFLAFAPDHTEELALMVEDALKPEFVEVNPAAEEDSSPGSASGNLMISNWLFSGPGPRTLNKGKTVRPSNRPEVYLYPDTSEDVRELLARERFLRNFTLSTYRDGIWYPKTMVPKTLSAEGGQITQPANTSGKKVSYEIFHRSNRQRETLAITLPNFTSIQQPTLRETTPDTFRLPRVTSRNGNYRYRVTSIPFDSKQVTILNPGESPSPEYLALPEDEELRLKIQNLASSFGPASSQSLTKLRNFFREKFTYSLEVDLPEEQDPVDSFLFENRQGYCSHFATATVLLTRAMGIPSRISFGWSGGRYFGGPNFFVFRAKEAHAWTEIHLKDLGWVIFDTTPPGRSEGQSSLAPPDEAPPLPDDHPEKANASEKPDLFPFIKGALWTGSTAFMLLAATFLFRRNNPQGENRLPGQTVLPEAPHYLTAFRRACLTSGNPIPLGRTLRAHLTSFPAPDFTSSLVDYHYAVHYGGQDRNRAFEKELLGKIRRWEKSQSPSHDVDPTET